MPSLAKIQAITEQVLQDYPAFYARYMAGDTSIAAPIRSIQHIMAEFGRDVDISEIEPFVRSKEASILADASNKGILPLCTPCQHAVEIRNTDKTHTLKVASGRVIEDGQGRAWRLLQSVNVPADSIATVTAEQSEIKQISYSPEVTETFHNLELELEDDLYLFQLDVEDQDNNSFSFVTRWMNTNAGDYTITLKTNTRRKIIMEFGDSERFGRTLEVGNVLSIRMFHSHGDIDVSQLREASLKEVNNSVEQRAVIRFKPDGLIKRGANPLTIEQMSLLSSYPLYDDNPVFLGNFNFSTLKKFLSRSEYLNVWNEVVEEQHYGASYLNINKLFVAVNAKFSSEQSALQDDIRQYLGKADQLYSGDDKVIFKQVVERPFQLFIKGLLSPVHDIENVKEQIKTLLLRYYGRGTTAACYYLPNGLNHQELGKVLKTIAAFQDRSSDIKLATEDLSLNPPKPHEWLYLTEDSIHIDIATTTNVGESRWSVLL